jgi:hypothetical protein
MPLSSLGAWEALAGCCGCCSLLLVSAVHKHGSSGHSQEGDAADHCASDDTVVGLLLLLRDGPAVWCDHIDDLQAGAAARCSGTCQVIPSWVRIWGHHCV